MRWLAAIIVALASSQLVLAQRTPGMLISSPPPIPVQRRHFSQEPILLITPWFAGYSPVVAQPAAPPVIMVQTQPAVVEPKKEPKLITPLLIELQNGRYVRSDASASNTLQVLRSRSTATPRAAADLTPVVLVFRDGHRERVREYTVADGALYAHGDFWTDGYWNKKILLSALDLPTTLAVNRESGVDFVLPSAPNVVVMRP
jgi:hypothetical protein